MKVWVTYVHTWNVTGALKSPKGTCWPKEPCIVSSFLPGFTVYVMIFVIELLWWSRKLKVEYQEKCAVFHKVSLWARAIWACWILKGIFILLLGNFGYVTWNELKPVFFGILFLIPLRLCTYLMRNVSLLFELNKWYIESHHGAFAYRKSSIKPPGGGLFISNTFEGGGGGD